MEANSAEWMPAYVMVRNGSQEGETVANLQEGHKWKASKPNGSQPSRRSEEKTEQATRKHNRSQASKMEADNRDGQKREASKKYGS